MKKRKWAVFIFSILLLALGVVHIRPAMAGDAEKIKNLERLIREQQRQLELMQRQLNEIKQTAEAADAKAEEVKTAVKEPPVEKVVTSGQARVKLAVSGQVNRAANVVGDGEDTDVYYVDNDASNTRIRFVGTAKATDDLTIGTRIEFALGPNESSQVSQLDPNSGFFFNERWADVSLDSKRYGKISFGWGDTASNNSAEVDMSKTDVVAYSSIADIVGGMYFRQKDDNTLTNIRTQDAFNNFDGLSRQARVRYDTPTFYGFQLAASAVSDSRYDASLWWGGEGYGFRAAGALAFANPNLENSNQQYDGSFSILHEKTGLNLTLSAGLKALDSQDNATNFYVKGGWLTRFFSVGQTAFSLDYTNSDHLPTPTDHGWAMGAAVVQVFEKYGTEIYLQYRRYTLDRGAGSDVYNIDAGTLGTRVKF
jgi:hypothetical protein